MIATPGEHGVVCTEVSVEGDSASGALLSGVGAGGLVTLGPPGACHVDEAPASSYRLNWPKSDLGENFGWALMLAATVGGGSASATAFRVWRFGILGRLCGITDHANVFDKLRAHLPANTQYFDNASTAIEISSRGKALYLIPLHGF